MRHTPGYLLTDPEEIRRLVRENPWATFVSHTDGGIVASHYPVLLDDAASTGDDIVIVSHFGRPDEVLHALGSSEILVIIAGPHGYISPSWYAPEDFVPTWNHVTAHLYGTPELLEPEENFAVLDRLTDHFEARMPDPEVPAHRRGVRAAHRQGHRGPAPASHPVRRAREAQPEQDTRGGRAHHRGT